MGLFIGITSTFMDYHAFIIAELKFYLTSVIVYVNQYDRPDIVSYNGCKVIFWVMA